LVVEVNQYGFPGLLQATETISDVMELFASGGQRKDGTVASSGHQ